jgi:two-component system, response regulator, stage 0 sporulation protein F
MTMSTPTPLPPAIVLVDDEPDVRIILHRVLIAVTTTYDLIAVGTGAAAVEILERRFAPLLITDYNMPGMTGLELAQAVKATSPTTTIVLITAYGTRDLARRSRAAGVDYYLPKPFLFDQLEAIVRNALA